MSALCIHMQPPLGAPSSALLSTFPVWQLCGAKVNKAPGAGAELCLLTGCLPAKAAAISCPLCCGETEEGPGCRELLPCAWQRCLPRVARAVPAHAVELQPWHSRCSAGAVGDALLQGVRSRVLLVTHHSGSEMGGRETFLPRCILCI